MPTYTQRVRDSILPLSIGDTLPKAFEEWRFTGTTWDHETATETCELCGKESIRYHFEIANQFTSHALWVGSHCILQFDVAVFDPSGRRLSAADAKKTLDKLREKMRLESCLNALEKLARSENNAILRGALEYYRKNKNLSPKMAFVVFWKLSEFKIDHSPSFFKINLKRHRYANDLKSMPTDRVHRFWKALSSSQRQRAVEMGHIPPLE
jgi:hypothetical protein